MSKPETMDVLQDWQNGCDGVLRSFELLLAQPQGFCAKIELEVVGASGWALLIVQFDEVDSLRLGDWAGKVSGGNVLYDGARLVFTAPDAMVLDLSPGPAWHVTSGPQPSQFIISGRGSYSMSPIESK